MASNLKFPEPGDVPRKIQAVLCPAERVLGLYNNQPSDPGAKRISKSVRDWFYKEAHAKGWKGVEFIQEVATQHGAGCVLWLEEQGSTLVDGRQNVLGDDAENGEA